MKSSFRTTKTWLLEIATEVAFRLKTQTYGTCLRIRVPHLATPTNTGGWSTIIGDLGKGEPRLVVWLDKFAGYPERKLYAGFCSREKEKIEAITKAVSKELWPIRVITDAEINEATLIVVSDRLKACEFSAPIYEIYERGFKFYGIYDPTADTTEASTSHFFNRATSFFEDVARVLPNAEIKDPRRDIYPRCENRHWVNSHLQRERSSLLATECKIRDGYKCQVCERRFEDIYGKLGNGFAEAHHLVPLSRLQDDVKTRLVDLATVCANCHRMLHRMDGRPDDIKKLKAIYQHASGQQLVPSRVAP